MDDEIKGEGNSLNYTFRMHDPRVGRFFAVDPLTTEYLHNSPYAFAENRVIDGVELEGQEYIFFEVSRVFEETGQCIIYRTGEIDYDNWALNAATKVFGNFELYPSYLVQSPIDGRYYFFESEEAAYTAVLDDFDPETRLTLDGLNSLYTVTDAIGGVLTGVNIKGGSSSPSGKVSQKTIKTHKVKKPKESSSTANSSSKAPEQANIKLHKNNNDYVGHQGVYQIEIDGKLYKYGKADMTTTAANGKPKRLQDQISKLKKQNPNSDVTGDVIYENKNISTRDVKRVETTMVQRYANNNGELPSGNQGHPGVVVPKQN